MYIKKWEILERIVVIGITVWMLLLYEAEVMAAPIYENLTRLHVVANSDSASDQAMKYEVRDAVLKETEKWTQGSRNAQEARERLASHLEEIEQRAQEVVRESGYEVKAVLYDELYFDRREYEGFTLPAGEYTALRVEIGEAAGANWWCVAFPPLCTAASIEELEQKAHEGGLGESQIKLILQTGEEYEIRFWLLDCMHRLFK